MYRNSSMMDLDFLISSSDRAGFSVVWTTGSGFNEWWECWGRPGPGLVSEAPVVNGCCCWGCCGQLQVTLGSSTSMFASLWICSMVFRPWWALPDTQLRWRKKKIQNHNDVKPESDRFCGLNWFLCLCLWQFREFRSMCGFYHTVLDTSEHKQRNQPITEEYSNDWGHTDEFITDQKL